MSVILMILFVLWVIFCLYQVAKVNKSLASKYNNLFTYIKQRKLKNTSLEDNKAFDNYIKHSLLGMFVLGMIVGMVFMVNYMIG